MGLPLVYRKQPTIMPRNKDEYTSLVIKARTMAATGGSKDATVPQTKLVCSTSPSANAAVIRTHASAKMTSRNWPNRFIRGEFIMALL